ncbi:MAG: hypothetical protein J6K89_01565 [Oscillospiraceae bacterium]|nr:hypothetical protein [Oscillospiraceae bacterium]
MAPSGSYRQVYAGCPFYQYDDGKRKIVCEGIVEDSTVTLGFKKREGYETQITTFCCEHYKKCEVYRMLMQKYEED